MCSRLASRAAAEDCFRNRRRLVVDGLEDMERLIEMAQGVTKGDPDAPVTIIEFGH